MAKKTLKRKHYKNTPASGQTTTVSNTVQEAAPTDKYLLKEVPVIAEPTYTPDYINWWESWNPERWGKYDYSDYPTQELANKSAYKKLGDKQDYVYKKEILNTVQPLDVDNPGSATYDEAFNKYFEFIKDNEGAVRDKKTGLHIPYKSKEKPKKGQPQTYTIGYGHLLKPGEENDPKYKNGLTDEEVQELFKSDFQNHYNHLKKSLGEDYINSIPFDQQIMLTDYDYNVGSVVGKFPLFLNAVKSYNAATTEEEKEAQRKLIGINFSRVYTDTNTGKKGSLHKRNSSLLDSYLIPLFKIRKAMVDPKKYVHPGVKEPNWIYGMTEPIDDNRGQWAHPGEVTRIDSSAITMAGVPYPVLGVGADGEQRMMYPNEEHTFNQAPVTEYPMMEAKNGGWLYKYQEGGWQPNQEDLRADGTKKGTGYLGVLNRPDGGVSSEISIGVEIDGKEVEIPSIVPTLTSEEVNYLLNNPTDENLWKTEIGKRIMDKAYDHAMMRMNKGLSPFYQEGEERQDRGNSGESFQYYILPNGKKVRVEYTKEGPSEYNPVTQTISFNPNNDPDNPEAVLQHEGIHAWQDENGQMHIDTPESYGPLKRPNMMQDGTYEAINYFNRRPLDEAYVTDKVLQKDPEFRFVPDELLYNGYGAFPGVNALMYVDPNTIEGEARDYENAYRRGEVHNPLIQPAYKHGGILNTTDNHHVPFNKVKKANVKIINPTYKNGGLTQYATGGEVFSAGGEKHKVYKKESPTGNGKGVKGHIMVTHPTKDKGKWDTIDLTEIAGAKTVAEGISSTKKWHKENPK